MSLMDKAQALERRLKLKPQDIEIIVRVNPCYDCEGCDKCAEYHRQVNTDQQTKVIVVNGEED